MLACLLSLYVNAPNFTFIVFANNLNDRLFSGFRVVWCKDERNNIWKLTHNEHQITCLSCVQIEKTSLEWNANV